MFHVRITPTPGRCRLRLLLRAVRIGIVALAWVGPAASWAAAPAGPPGPDPKQALQAPEDAGRFERQVVEVRGSSMMPLVRPGAELWLLRDYYRERPVERGHIVAYRYAGRAAPVLKVVRAVAGDRWELEDMGGAYRIRVNGVLLTTSGGPEYVIAKGSARRLKLYADSYPIIPGDTCLLLGDDPAGSIDSTVFGLIARQDLVGRVVRPAAEVKVTHNLIPLN